MDKDRTGDVSLSEFKAWWKTSRVVFTVKRDAGIPGDALRDLKAFSSSKPRPSKAEEKKPSRGTSSRFLRRTQHMMLTEDQARALSSQGLPPGPLRITAYSGESKYPVIEGLTPNTLYRLQLTLRTNIFCSLPSKSVPVMTTPSKVRDPGLVLVARGSRWVRIAWYENFSGAHRYVVEMLKEKAGDTKQEWKSVWQGQETTATIAHLADKSKYFFRVFACNAFGGRSVPAYMSPVPNTKAASTSRLRVGRIVGVHTMTQRAYSKTKYTATSEKDLLPHFPVPSMNDIIPGDEVMCCLCRRLKHGEVLAKMYGGPDDPAVITDMADEEWLCTVTAVVTGCKWRKRTSKVASSSVSRRSGPIDRDMDRVLVLDIVSALKPVPSTGRACRLFLREVCWCTSGPSCNQRTHPFVSIHQFERSKNTLPFLKQ